MLRDRTRFVDIFADHCHHDKENKYLFPLLKKKDMPQIDDELCKLADDHHVGRAMAAKFERSAVAYLSHRPGSRRELARAMRHLAELYEGHIEREERVLLPLMEGNLSRREQDWLRDMFSEIGCTSAWTCIAIMRSWQNA